MRSIGMHINLKVIVLTVFLSLSLLILPFQKVEGQQYFIKSYAVENGLSTRLVSDVCQDTAGYMWFSTFLGISKYDGFSFVNYDSTSNLPTKQYRKIKCDETGKIWAIPNVVSGSLVYFENEKWNAIPLPYTKTAKGYITSFEIMYENNEPVICIGSYNGIDVYRNKSWKHYSVSDDKAQNIVLSVTRYKNDFYLGTNKGICVLRNSGPDWSLNQKINSSQNTVLAVKFESIKAQPDRMWVLTSKSIGYFVNTVYTKVADNFELEDVDIAHFPYLEITKNHDLIFGNNFSKYLFKTSENQLIPLRVKNGFSSNGASAVFIDREGNIWFTDSRGVDKVSNISIVNYFESGGLPANEVTAIAQMADGKFVLGHNNLISILDDNKFTRIEFPGYQNSISRVLDINKDSEGNIWFTANNLGVGRINRYGKITWFSTGKDARTTTVNQDNSGRIWIGTNKRMMYFENGTVKEYEHSDERAAGIRKIFKCDTGGIYVTGMNGLWHFNKQKITKIKFRGPNQLINTFSYFKDRNNAEFVGTMNGLYYIENGEIIPYRKNGITFTNPVYFILQDNDDFYWIGTNNGVMRWDGKNEPETFNPINGLAGRETNRSAGFLDSKGRIWVGTDRGLSCFTSGSGNLNTNPPRIKLLYTETLKGQKYPLSQECSISSNDNTLSFHFRGLSFVNEALMMYKYRLKGYDVEWREATQDMLDKIKYVNLKPGKYHLEVMVKNYSSNWSQVIHSAEIKIRQPFYYSWWFISLLLIAFGSMLRTFHIVTTEKVINKTLKKEIQERIIAEDELKKSEQRLSFVVEGSRLGTWDWDIENNKVHRNTLWAEMLGYSIEEIEGTHESWIKLIHTEDRERVTSEIAAHQAGKTPTYEIIYRIRTKQNSYRWILDRAMIVQRDSNGKPLRMSGTHTDITERKHAEQALQKSEERIRLLLESLPISIYISPINSAVDLEMITGNVKTLTGFTEEEYLSTNDFWRNRLHPDDREMVLDAFLKAPEAGSITIEYRWLHADGTYKWFHDQAIVKQTDERKEYLGIIIDIDERKQAEREINKKNEQLYQINAEKDKLFSIISHDLRSPVNGFLGLTSLLLEELDSMETAQIKEIAGSMLNSATKVNDLLNDLLEWSRLQRGITQFTPQKTQLRKLVLECTELVQEVAQAKDIQINCEISENITLEADQHMLQVVLRNLLTNAVKFTHKNGEVKVNGFIDKGGVCNISVSDTGIGMNNDLLVRIFKVNEKTSRKGTEGEPSSGLGLILCKEFVERHGGKIWVESEENKGSTFSFTIPQ